MNTRTAAEPKVENCQNICPHCEQPINPNIAEAPTMVGLADSLEAKNRVIDELRTELAKERARLEFMARKYAEAMFINPFSREDIDDRMAAEAKRGENGR